MYKIRIRYFMNEQWLQRWQSKCFSEIPIIDKSIDPFQTDINAGSVTLSLLYNDKSVEEWDIFVRETFESWHFIELWYNEKMLFDGKVDIESGYDDFLSVKLIGRYASIEDFDVEFEKTLDHRLTFEQVFWTYANLIDNIFPIYAPLGGLQEHIDTILENSGFQTDFAFEHSGSYLDGLKKLAFIAGGHFVFEGGNFTFKKLDRTDYKVADGKLVDFGYKYQDIENIYVDLDGASFCIHENINKLNVTALADVSLSDDDILVDTEGNKWEIIGSYSGYFKEFQRSPIPQPEGESYLFPYSMQIEGTSTPVNFSNIQYIYTYQGVYDHEYIFQIVKNKLITREKFKEYRIAGINTNIEATDFFQYKGMILYAYNLNRDCSTNRVDIIGWEV